LVFRKRATEKLSRKNKTEKTLRKIVSGKKQSPAKPGLIDDLFSRGLLNELHRSIHRSTLH
jgi:hypothetical protein